MQTRRRILFLNRSYWPDAEATGQLLTELCEDLAARFEVGVIAGQPNENPENQEYRRTGEQIHNSVAIRRVFHTRFSKSSLVGRAINILTFQLSAFLSACFAAKPDIVVVETDPPFLCLVGAWLQRWRGCKLVVYLQDIYPDIAIALGKLREAGLGAWIRARFLAIYRRADRVIVLSEDMRSLLEEWGLSRESIVVIPNWIDARTIQPVKKDNAFRAEHGLKDRFVVMYSGNLGLCQQLEDVLAAAAQLQDCPEIQFVLIGGGASKMRLQQMAVDQGLKNVRFMNYQPQRRLSESLSAANLHLIPLDPRIIRCMMPSKLYGILASGTPLVAVTPEDCELSRLVRTERIGFVVRPGEPRELANQIRACAQSPDVLAEMALRARSLVESRYDRRAITAQMAELLADVAGAGEESATHSDGTSPSPHAGGSRRATIAEELPAETT